MFRRRGKKLLLLHHGKGGRLGAASGKQPHQKVNVPFFPRLTQAGKSHFPYGDRVSLCSSGWPETQRFACLCLPELQCLKHHYHTCTDQGGWMRANGGPRVGPLVLWKGTKLGELGKLGKSSMCQGNQSPHHHLVQMPKKSCSSV